MGKVSLNKTSNVNVLFYFRAIQFCESLVNTFNFHHFDNLKYSAIKEDPRRGNYEQKGLEAVTLLFAANAGDRFAMERMLMQVSSP